MTADGFRRVRLTTNDHEFVAYVTIPAFQASPDVLMWGDRFFARAWGAAGPVVNGATFREVSCVAVVPIAGIAENDGTDP